MISTVFIQTAANILGDSNCGLTSARIVEMCAAYAADYGVDIPYHSSPLPVGTVPNKRTALKKNLYCFSAEQQYRIIKDLCELEQFRDNENVKQLKVQLVTRYGSLDKDGNGINQIHVDETKHWLSDFPSSLREYESTLAKFKGKIFQRNLLDDLRLSLELLLKSIFNNEKSLENQLGDTGTFVQSK